MTELSNLENENNNPDTKDVEAIDLRQNIGRHALGTSSNGEYGNYPYDDYGMDSQPYGWC